MNRNFFILIVLWIASVVGISFKGGPLTYGIFFTLTLVPIVSLIYIFIVYSRFRIYQQLDAANLVCGRTSDFYLTLQNESPIGFFGVRVRFYSSFSVINGLDDAAEYEIDSRNGIAKQTSLLCKCRGEYEVGIKRVEITDYLRLFTISYKNREPLRVSVKPSLVYVDGLKTADIVLNAVRDTRLNPTETDIPTREYTIYDDSRMINWKVTAAKNKLMVREKTGEQQLGIGIIIDSKRISDDIYSYLPVESKILETALALALFFTGKRIPVTAYSFNGELHRDQVDTIGEFDAFYGHMDAFSFREETDRQEMYERILWGTDISSKKAAFIITHSFDGNTAKMVDSLCLEDMTVIVYVITDEEADYEEISGKTKAAVISIPTNCDLREVL